MTTLNNQEWQGVPSEIGALLMAVPIKDLAKTWDDFVSIKNVQDLSALLCENSVLTDFSDTNIGLALDIVFAPLLHDNLLATIVDVVSTYLGRTVSLEVGVEPNEAASESVQHKRDLLNYSVQYWVRCLSE